MVTNKHNERLLLQLNDGGPRTSQTRHRLDSPFHRSKTRFIPYDAKRYESEARRERPDALLSPCFLDSTH
jgi:hypothetical protein